MVGVMINYLYFNISDIELYSQEGEIIEWYPKEKIRYVKRKLKGENPAYITRYKLLD